MYANRCKLPPMTTITFDTLKFANTLKEAGVPDKQAEAQARAQRDSLAEALDTTLSTKSDIVNLENRISILDAKVDAKFALLQWMIWFNLAVTMAVLWKVFS